MAFAHHLSVCKAGGTKEGSVAQNVVMHDGHSGQYPPACKKLDTWGHYVGHCAYF